MYYQNGFNNDNRGFFLPFVVGALAGGAAVGISRPRPVVVTSGPNYMPYGYYNYPYYPYNYPYYRPY